MARARKPNSLHYFMRFVGMRFRGLKGLDRFFRMLHHPDKRHRWYIAGIFQAPDNGPLFHLRSDFFSEWTSIFYGSHDRTIHRWISNNVKKNWICFDIGANFGYYTCLLAELAREVHAFDPVSSLIQRVQTNVDLNGYTNVRIQCVAISDRIGTATFHLPRTTSANWGTGSLVRSGQGQETNVLTTTLDAYVNNNRIPALDFLKIDVEGTEYPVLVGGQETIRKHRPRIILENNLDDSWIQSGQIHHPCAEFLWQHGYRLFDLHGALLTKVPHPNACSDFLAIHPTGQ